MAKEKRATWFKIFLHQRAIMDAVPDDVLGRALKAAIAYLDTGEEAALSPLEGAVYASMKQFVDESVADYQRDTDNGKKGGRPKKNPGLPQVTQDNRPLPSLTEAEAEADAEADAEAEANANAEERVCNKPGKPARARFVAPGVQEVLDYCREQGYEMDAQRFVDYYTSVGWKVGKSPMKDWKAAVRNWYRKEEPRGTTEPKFTWTVGHVL